MTNLQEYKCPACGGAIGFDTKLQKMKCSYCDSEFEVESLKAYDAQLKEDQVDVMDWETPIEDEWADANDELKMYGCKSCGGELMVDANTTATACPYCDNPIVLMDQLNRGIKPQLIIPFKLDKEKAKANLLNHLKDKKFLPKIFKDKNHIDEIKGVYVPFWIFDTESQASYRYEGIKEENYSDNHFDYIKKRHYSIIREGSFTFEGVPVDGSSIVDDTLMEAIEPFDLKEATEFQTAYLAGYFADKYDVSKEETVDRANQRIKRSIEDEIAQSLRLYDETDEKSGHVHLHNGKARYVLYPVWFLNTTWQNEKYRFAMNGQTGKFVGDLPVDKGLYWQYFAKRALIVSAIFYVIGTFIF